MDWYVLAINPEPWKVGPAGVARRSGKLVPYIGRDQQLDAYKQAIKEAVTPIRFIEGPVKLRFFFWRNRADYKTPQARTARKHEVDVTNLQKATEDALQNLLFKNDKDTNDIWSVFVNQGPDVIGKVVIGVEENPHHLISVRLPNEVWELVEAIDTQARNTDSLSADQAWGMGADAPF